MASSDMKYPWPSTVNVANFISVKPSLQDEERITNFHIWKAQMVCLLESQGLLGFINGEILEPLPTENITTIPEDQSSNFLENGKYEQTLWRRTDRLVKGWILGSIGRDALGQVWELDTAREVWLELEKIFDKENSASGNPTKNTEKEDLKEYLSLHKAALQGNWEKARQIFSNDPGAMKASITTVKETALHIAVGTGKTIRFVENLVAEMPNELMAIVDKYGDTALHNAAAVGNKAAAIILLKKMPELLYIKDSDDEYPLQVAALYAQRHMLEYFILITQDDAGQKLYADSAGLKLLLYVIDAEFFDIAIHLVKTYPNLAGLKLQDTSALSKIIAKKSIFFSSRNFNFWQRCISSGVSMETIFNPQFKNGRDLESMAHNSQTMLQSLHAKLCKFLNGIGLIKSIKEKKLLKLQALELVKVLCQKIELFSFVEASDIYFDAIMLAAKLGIHEVIEEIIKAFPSAIYWTKSDSDHNIFHVAVKNRSEHVYNLVYQMSDHKHFFSDSIDFYGDNLLHLAGKLAPYHKLNEISGAALQMQREIQWYKEVENFVSPQSREQLNSNGKSPKMVFTEEHKILKEEGEKWMKDTSNSCTIAAALIAMVMFTAAITVPGGNDSSNGLPIFSRNGAFIAFAIADAISLFTSVTSLLMFLAILTSRYAEEDFLNALPKRLIIGLGTLFISITFMMVAFSATLYLVFGRKQALFIILVATLASLPVTSFMRLQYPLLVDLICSTYGPGIFGKQSNHLFY